MATVNHTPTYRSPSMSLVALAVLVGAVACLGMAVSQSHHGRVVEQIAGIVGFLVCICLACAYMPDVIRFDQREQQYEVVTGLGPFARTKSGFYCDLDSICVHMYTTYSPDNRGSTEFYASSGTWNTTFTIYVMWATERRRLALANRRDIGQAQYVAEEIAAASGVPYGGVYDYRNAMWLKGPFHKQVAPQAHQTEAEIADKVDAIAHSHALGAGLPAHSSTEPASHQDTNANTPPALGDDAGLNDESGMWK